MLPLCGACGPSVAQKRGLVDGPPTAAPSRGVEESRLPALHSTSVSPPAHTQKTVTKKPPHSAAGSEQNHHPRTPAQPAEAPETGDGVSVSGALVHRQLPSQLQQLSLPTSPLPPAPNSILVAGLAHFGTEAASRNSRRTSKAGSLSHPSSSSRPQVPALRLDRVQLPPLDIADVSVPADSCPCPLSKSAGQPPQRSFTPSPQHGGRSRGCMPHADDDVARGDTTSEAMVAFAETPGGMARRSSVRFLSHQDEAASGTHSCSHYAICGAGIVTPRSGTPYRRLSEVDSVKGDRPSDLWSGSGSLRPDTPPPLCDTQDTLIHEGEGGVDKIDFMSLSFTARMDAAHVQGRRTSNSSGVLLSGSGGTSASATSCPSPTSILLKSNTITTPSSNGTTIGNANHPSWHSSQHAAPRGGGWSGRRGLREHQAGTPEHRPSSSSTPHFVDGSERMQRISRHDSDSSDDARTVESVKSAVARIHKRKSATSSTGEV